MKLKVIKDQIPIKRFIRNFFITGNALGMFSYRSHLTQKGTPKVMYNTVEKMYIKHNKHFSNYKCLSSW